MRKLAYYSYRFKWWLTEHTNWTPSQPLHIDLELSSQCNLACTFCRHGIDPNPKEGLMPTDMAMHYINEAADMGIPSIKFQFRGESALHKDLEDLIQYAKVSGILETQLNTNLVAFNAKRLRALCDSGLDRLIISIDGATRKTYEKLRAGAKWRKLIEHLKLLQTLDKKPIIRIQMVHQDDNEHELNEFIDKFLPLCDELNIKPIRSVNFGHPRKSCPQPRQRLIIGYNGNFYGCCNAWYDESLIHSRYLAGEQLSSIKSMWAGLALHDLQKEARKPDSGAPCNSCLVRSSFK